MTNDSCLDLKMWMCWHSTSQTGITSVEQLKTIPTSTHFLPISFAMWKSIATERRTLEGEIFDIQGHSTDQAYWRTNALIRLRFAERPHTKVASWIAENATRRGKTTERSINTYQALEEYLSGGEEMGGRSKMSRSQCLTNTILTLDRSSREESFNQSSQ